MASGSHFEMRRAKWVNKPICPFSVFCLITGNGKRYLIFFDVHENGNGDENKCVN